MMKKTVRGLARYCCAMILLLISLTTSAQEDLRVYAGRGPVLVHVPPGYSPGLPTPLVIGIHGHGSSGRVLENYLQFAPISDERGFLLAFPDGLRDDTGKRYWNATDACCGNRDTDDAGYLRDLIGVISARFTVDPRRILIFGSSNGGFMAHRVGCDLADLVAAFVSLSGATWYDASQCTPVAPVHAVEIHGTADIWPAYGGGCTGPETCYPSALQTAQTWADLNHCSAVELMPLRLDLIEDIPGPETSMMSFTGCDAGGSSALWTIVNGEHHPVLSPLFSAVVLEDLLSHPKPTNIPCDDVAGLRAQCGPASTLTVYVPINDPGHNGTTIDLTVDGELIVAPVVQSQAQRTLPGQSPGVHVVRLVEPADCAAEVEVTCGE